MMHLPEHWQDPALGWIALWVVSLVLRAMPEPRDNSSLWYLWLFRISQLVSANSGRLRTPGQAFTMKELNERLGPKQ